MIIVTGGLGFIGYNLIKKLNSMKINNIIVVDYKKKKFNSLKKIKYKKFIDVNTFYKNLKKNIPNNTRCIFHQGANSSTTETNKEKIYQQNYYSSIKLVDYCQLNKIKLIYASSASTYGIKEKKFNENNWYLNPGNLYAETKFLLDKYVKKILYKKNFTQIVGLRYFNVYGPYEFHKNNMASVMLNFDKQIKKFNIIKVFEGNDGYKNGEQVRDFIHVDDCININLYFYKKNISGIFNVGSGKKSTFNNVAKLVLNFHKKKNKIRYIKFPKNLIGKYQSYTKANIEKLKKNGYKKKFISLKLGVNKYLKFLKNYN